MSKNTSSSSATTTTGPSDDPRYGRHWRGPTWVRDESTGGTYCCVHQRDAHLCDPSGATWCQWGADDDEEGLDYSNSESEPQHQQSEPSPMTEAQWLTSDDPSALLLHLRAEAVGTARGGTHTVFQTRDDASLVSDRKLRLFACACCRQTHPAFVGLPLATLLAAERSADGTPVEAGLLDYCCDIANHGDAQHGKDLHSMANAAACCLWDELNRDASIREVLLWTGRLNLSSADQADLLREIVGNPFRPLTTLAPHWRTPDVLSLAHAAYDLRVTDKDCAGRLDVLRLAVLSDALEEAGCDQPALLEHLRAVGLQTHYRGCWALDLILGKE